MLDDINDNKNNYNYDKKFTLEEIYGSIIK